MRLTVLTFCLLISVGCTPSKIMISGQVVSNNGLPIDRAEVTTNPPTDVVTTDREGYFFLTRRVGGATGQAANIEAGIYNITVRKDGYQPLTIQVNALKGKVWAKRHKMEAEKALVPEVAPDAQEDPDRVIISDSPMIGQ
jgi:hypothetical protein